MLTPEEVFENTNDYYNLVEESNNKIRKDNTTNLRTKNGTVISARHNIFDIKIIKEQFLDLQYFPKVIGDDFKPKVVLDIGGYIGDLTLYCASVYSAKVHCYEPTPQNYRMVQKNLELNPHLNITAFNKGVSANNESISLNIQDLTGEIHASSHKTYDKEVTTIDIPCVSLVEAINTMNEPRIDLLKIDCEGQEFEILKDINSEYLAKNVDYLVFEYHKFVDDYQSKLERILKNLELNFDILKKTKKLCFLKGKV